MNLKKLLALVVLAIGTLNTYAQEEDYTSYINNANLASTDGWTFTVTQGQNWSSIQGSEPSFVIEAYAGWGSLALKDYSMTQDVTLPSGKYRAEGYAFYRYGLNADTDPSKSYAQFVAGDFSAPVVTLGGETLDETLTAYPNSTGEASTAFTNGYYKSVVEFSVESEQTITFGYVGTHVLKQSWFIAGPIKLFRTGDFDFSLYEEKLAGAVNDAKALYNETMSASALTNLKTAVADNDKTWSSVAEYNTASDNIRAAIAAANISISSYKVIAAGVVPDNSLDGWVCENSNTFHINTWSVEGNSDGSNMKTPFIENWVANGSYLGAGKVYYQLAGLEPGEVYYAQALVRSYNEKNSDAPNGPNFFINDTYVDMTAEGTTFTYNGMSGIFATLGGAATVGEDGKLTLGVEIKEDRNYNWVAFKSVSIMPMADALAKAMNAAKAYQNVEMADEVKQALNSVINTYDGATLTTPAEYETAIAALNEATERAKESAEAYRIAKYYIELADGAYYIIDATSGKMMAAGHNYGTRGIVKEFGLDLTLTTDVEAHTVTFDSRVSNGGNNHFLGSNLYMDSPAFGWYLDKQDNGLFYITNDEQYISIDADDNLVMSDEPYAWAIVSADAVIAAGIEEFANATAEAPVDATFLISGANFNRNDARNAGWSTWSETADQGTNLTISGGNEVNNCAESLHAQFYVQQTIQGVPNGIYRLTAQGFYRQDGEDTENLPVFFANGETATFPVLTGSENGMSDASASFSNGAYTIEPIEFVVEDGTITLGAKLETNTTLWCIFDNFQLVYAGPVPPAFPEEGAVGYLFNVQSKLLVNANGNLVGRTLADKDADLFTVWRKSSDKIDGSEVRLAAGKTGDKWNALRFNDKGLVVCESEDYSKWKLEKDGSYWLLKHNYDSSNGGADATGNVGKGYLTVNPETRMFEVTAESTDYSLWQFITWEEYESLTTTIGSVSEKAAQKGIFNVAGQQMKALQKGLNIVDGKKIYVK